MSGTELGAAAKVTRCPVLRQAMLLRAYYAMSGTKTGAVRSTTTNSGTDLRYATSSCGSDLRYAAAISGSDLRYAAASSGTDLRYTTTATSRSEPNQPHKADEWRGGRNGPADRCDLSYSAGCAARAITCWPSDNLRWPSDNVRW
eukprot:3365680-Rhodomonas_salina.2